MKLASVPGDANGNENPRNGSGLNFSTPAGWAMFYFVIAVVFLGIMFLSM